MGRRVLRRKILNIHPINRPLALLLLAGALASAWAGPDGDAPEIDRPLRQIPLDGPSRFTPPPPPLPENSLLTPEALEHPLTQRYITQYSRPAGIAWLNGVIRNGSLYLPFIREEIAKRNMPPELLYLPVIESGYLGTAKSRSGAVGLWQFMMNSIAPFDMKVTDLVDERRDFRKSTVGALLKLDENHRLLGNWPLALAAYNSGLGGVSRVTRRTGIHDYWRLCEKKELRSETIQYVPKLAAVAYILSQPRRFGVDYWPEAVAWTAIPVPRQASLDIIASETGIDRDLLRRLNLELLHGITPPDPAYRLKVPADQALLAAAVMEREDLKLLTFYRHQVKFGDTLSALSRQYGVTLGLIEQHNPGILNRYLKIGETITIPAFNEAAAVRQRLSAAAGPAAVPSSFNGIHQVKRGDTLWSIATRYKVDPQTLARENGMELNQILPEGKVLKVPIMEE
jgi:membrane-bound lytic murein transglycosylase D